MQRLTHLLAHGRGTSGVAGRRLHTAPVRCSKAGPSIGSHIPNRSNTVVRQPRDNKLQFGTVRGGINSGIEHHSVAHLHEEVELWKKVTAGGSVVVALCLLNFLAAEHSHFHQPPPYPYLRIRNKPLPWGDGTKDLLDVRDEYVQDHHHH